MADFREQEPLGYIRVYWGQAPMFRDLYTEYWHAGKVYALGDKVAEDMFVNVLTQQNVIDNTDVAPGPAYDFADSTGHRLELPRRIPEVGHIALYNAVGHVDSGDTEKKEIYLRRLHFWDGVGQHADYKTAAALKNR